MDIQHVGSTSIRHIKAKPDMLIAVGIKSLDMLGEVLPRLREIGIGEAARQSLPGTVLCSIISENDSGVHTLYVHILLHDSLPWQDNVNFRDYLNAFPHKAAEYESLKVDLAKRFPNDRQAYKNGKLGFFKRAFVEAREWKGMALG